MYKNSEFCKIELNFLILFLILSICSDHFRSLYYIPCKTESFCAHKMNNYTSSDLTVSFKSFVIGHNHWYVQTRPVLLIEWSSFKWNRVYLLLLLGIWILIELQQHFTVLLLHLCILRLYSIGRSCDRHMTIGIHTDIFVLSDNQFLSIVITGFQQVCFNFFQLSPALTKDISYTIWIIYLSMIILILS